LCVASVIRPTVDSHYSSSLILWLKDSNLLVDAAFSYILNAWKPLVIFLVLKFASSNIVYVVPTISYLPLPFKNLEDECQEVIIAPNRVFLGFETD